ILTPPGLGSSYLLLANATQKKGSEFTFTDNLVHVGTYGLGAENPPLGPSAATLLDGHFRAWTFTRNLFIAPQGPLAGHPPGQAWESSVTGVGLRDAARRDYELTTTSRYKRTAQDGHDPGADLQALRVAFRRFMTTPGPGETPPTGNSR